MQEREITRNMTKELTEAKGLKESISIAQIKEVLKILFTNYTLDEIALMYFKTNK